MDFKRFIAPVLFSFLFTIRGFCQDVPPIEKVMVACLNDKHFRKYLTDSSIVVIAKKQYWVPKLKNVMWLESKPSESTYIKLIKMKFRRDESGYFHAKINLRKIDARSSQAIRIKLKNCGDWMVYKIRSIEI